MQLKYTSKQKYSFLQELISHNSVNWIIILNIDHCGFIGYFSCQFTQASQGIY